MSGTVIPGGARTPAETSDAITVQQDGETVLQTVNTIDFIGAAVVKEGNGRVSVTTGAGAAIAIEQDGDELSPAITTLNITSPLEATLAGGGVADIGITINTDDTLTGDGTSGDPLGVVGAELANTVPVAVDGVTITGTGITGNPLVAVNPNDFPGVLVENLAVGTPVFVASANHVDGANGKDALGSLAVGFLILGGTTGQTRTVRTHGPLTLTAVEWGARTDSGAQLVPGTLYYLSTDAVGKIRPTEPESPGDYQSPVGVALSTTTFLINIQRTVGPLVG